MHERDISVRRHPEHFPVRAGMARLASWSRLMCFFCAASFAGAGCGKDAVSQGGPVGTGGAAPTAGTGGRASSGGSSGASGGAAGSEVAAVDAGAPGATGGGVGTRDAAVGSGGAPPLDAGGGGGGGGADATGWKLVWADEFDVDGPPDPTSWGFERGFVRNQELQWYQPANASVAGGILTIEGRKESVVNTNYLAGSTDWRRSRAMSQYTSSSMTTSGKHSFMYGRFSIRARIDTRRGSWPAFWTLGPGAWPQSGEVDIMEFYASNVLANVCKPAGATCGWSSVVQPLARLGATFGADFHVWTMEWDAQKIDLYLDDVLVNHFLVASAVAAGQPNPYVGKSMYLLVNLALGANGGDPAATTFPIQYAVDWVRVYQRSN